MLQFYMEEFGTSVSRACMGTMRLCSLERKEAFSILDAYRELGGNFMDSAHVYGRRLGGAQLADRIIGDWMRDRSCRGEMLVAGKGGHPPLGNKRIPRLSRQEVEADLDESLMAMGIEQMDLYYLHRDDESRSVEEIMEYLWDFIKAFASI